MGEPREREREEKKREDAREGGNSLSPSERELASVRVWERKHPPIIIIDNGGGCERAEIAHAVAVRLLFE